MTCWPTTTLGIVILVVFSIGCFLGYWFRGSGQASKPPVSAATEAEKGWRLEEDTWEPGGGPAVVSRFYEEPTAQKAHELVQRDASLLSKRGYHIKHQQLIGLTQVSVTYER